LVETTRSVAAGNSSTLYGRISWPAAAPSSALLERRTCPPLSISSRPPPSAFGPCPRPVEHEEARVPARPSGQTSGRMLECVRLKSLWLYPLGSKNAPERNGLNGPRQKKRLQPESLRQTSSLYSSSKSGGVNPPSFQISAAESIGWRELTASEGSTTFRHKGSFTCFCERFLTFNWALGCKEE
jgi:hypothetical protein